MGQRIIRRCWCATAVLVGIVATMLGVTMHDTLEAVVGGLLLVLGLAALASTYA